MFQLESNNMYTSHTTVGYHSLRIDMLEQRNLGVSLGITPEEAALRTSMTFATPDDIESNTDFTYSLQAGFPTPDRVTYSLD